MSFVSHYLAEPVLLLPPSRPRSLSLLLFNGDPAFLLDPETTRAVPFVAGLFVPDLLESLSSLTSIVQSNFSVSSFNPAALASQ
jgi:hypothetical protein